MERDGTGALAVSEARFETASAEETQALGRRLGALAGTARKRQSNLALPQGDIAQAARAGRQRIAIPSKAGNLPGREVTRAGRQCGARCATIAAIRPRLAGGNAQCCPQRLTSN